MDKTKKDMNKMQWYTPDKKPTDGQRILIREYYRNAKNGKFVNDYTVEVYLDEFDTFNLHERRYKHLGLKITHWMPIIDPKSK